MRAVKIDLSEELESVEIHTFADWHIGDLHCNMNNVMSQIEAVKNTPNAYCICNGDLLNNATKQSVSDVYAEAIPPMAQVERIVDLLTPIKDKILMVTQGNHEARSYRYDGIDITSLFCAQLGISQRYVREGGILFLRFGREKEHKQHHDNSKYRRICYTVYVTHGSGGGRKEGGKINRLADIASIIDADVYIHSHTHLPVIMKQAFYRTDLRNSTFASVEKLFINTSAQLEYGGYGETFGFKPSSTSTPIIYLSSYKRFMTAKL